MAERDWARWIGRRASVRYRLETPVPGAGSTDVVGTVLGLDGDTVLVDGRRGPTRVPLNAVVTARLVPPAPSRRGAPHTALSIAEVARIQTDHWRPRTLEPAGRWLLRAHDRVTARANSALCLGLPHDVAGQLARVQTWYAEREQPTFLMVPVPADAPGTGLELMSPGLREACATGVHRVGDDPAQAGRDGAEQLALADALVAGGAFADPPMRSAVVMTAATRAVIAGGAGEPPGPRIDLSPAEDPAWLAAYREDSPALRELLHSADEQVFAIARTTDGATAAGLRVSIADGWAGINSLEVLPAFRGRRVGGYLLDAAARWAHSRGARSIYLETEISNVPAHNLFLRKGFVVHHRYDYLRLRPARAAGDTAGS